MKDLNKKVKGEKAPDNQNDAKKEITKPTVIKQHEAVNKSMAGPKESPATAHLANSASEGAGEIITSDVDTKKEKKQTSKKSTKTNAKIADAESKTEGEIMVQNDAEADSKEEPGKPDSDKKLKGKIKVIKKNAKKAEEKVDKLRKKVKKAKKEDVKKSKLKDLKEKLEKVFEKLKVSVKKLKKAKK